MSEQGTTLDFAWRCDRGLVRQRNEDAVAVHPELGLVVVADGMGGANAGDIASAVAVQAVADRIRRSGAELDERNGALSVLRRALEDANRCVADRAAREPACAGMGTTLVAALFRGGCVHYAHVGDSRLYRLRGGILQQLTRDDSLIQEVVDNGIYSSADEARLNGVPDNVLVKAIGLESDPAVSSAASELAAGDLYLLCSDGLSGLVPPAGIAAVLAETSSGLEAAADALVEAACENGGIDNISVALAAVDR